tara:strand:- start:332 stop:1549 length:1218 start_codon:yes stop_codon:yes gene_type:complete
MPTADEKNKDFISKNPTVVFTLIVGLFLLSLALIYIWDPLLLSEKHPATIILIVLFLFFICAITLQFRFSPTSDDDSIYNNTYLKYIILILKYIGIITAVLFFIISIAWLFRNYSSASGVFTWIINILIISGAVGIVMLLLKNEKQIDSLNKDSNQKSYSYLSLIKNIFFYIPCLLISFANYIKEQYNITTKPVWIVLLLELTFIGSTFLLPYLYHNLSISSGEQLLRDPIYLNKKTTLGTFENLTSLPNGTYEFNYHYAISSWIYLNPQPPNTSEAYNRYASLLDYAGKPVIEYNGSLNSLRIRTETGNREIVHVYSTKDITYQKWMNIVINYDGANMDVFINGELVGTQANIAPYMSYDNVTSGENNGIHGGICNIVYYDKTLSKGDITMTYNLLKHLDTPIT